MQWEVIWEWAVENHVKGESWRVAADKLALQIKAGQWPKATLGELDPQVFNNNPKRLAEKLNARAETDHRDVRRSRQLVSAALQHVGQVYCDVDRLAPDMLMFDFFKPWQNRIMNAGAAVSLSKASVQAKALRDALPRLGANGARTPCSAANPENIDSVYSSSTSGSSAASTASLLQKGGKGTKGGALSHLQRAGVVELVVDDGVPMSSVGKVLQTAFVTLTGEVPTEKQTVGVGHVADWCLEAHALDMFDKMEKLQGTVKKYPYTMLHVHHDATGRADTKAGKWGNLMNFTISYFDPDHGRAVCFPLSLRFIAGKSAAHTARSLAVALTDTGLYKVNRSRDEKVISATPTEHGHVLGSVGSDNTDSALNVRDEMANLLRIQPEQLHLFPCPTHIVSLLGKNPINALSGHKSDQDAFHRDVPENIANMWWYVLEKHVDFLRSVHVKNGQGVFPDKPPRAIFSKWETVGEGTAYVMKWRSQIVRIAHFGAFMCKGDASKAGLMRDLELLRDWLTHPRSWFRFLVVLHGWHTRVVNPYFYWLKSPDAIFPESGPHFRRQSMPRVALELMRICDELPRKSDSPEDVQRKTRVLFSEACCPVTGLVDNKGVPINDVRSAWDFEITSQEKKAMLSELYKFGDAARTVCTKHLSKFLSAPWVFGLFTDDAQQHEDDEELEPLGAYFTRRIARKCLPGETWPDPRAIRLTGDAEKEARILDQYIDDNMGELKLAFQQLKLGDTAQKKADLATLCDQAKRESVDWTVKTLPGLAPFLQAVFFGGPSGNFMLESRFSSYGHHHRQAPERGGQGGAHVHGDGPRRGAQGAAHDAADAVQAAQGAHDTGRGRRAGAGEGGPQRRSTGAAGAAAPRPSRAARGSRRLRCRKGMAGAAQDRVGGAQEA